MGFEDEFSNPHEAGLAKGICIWCGEPGDSNEDVVPRWLNKSLHFPPGWAHGGPALLSRAGTPARPIQGGNVATRMAASKGCCQKCNNEWMSQLENEAKPLIAPMINGHQVRLSDQQQLTVARWGAMKAIVFDGDYRNGTGGMCSVAARQAVFELRQPPTDCVVTLASYERPGHFFVVMPFGQGTGQAGQPLTGWVFTMLLNCLVIQVSGQTGTIAAPAIQQHPGGALAADRVTVWPPQLGHLSWPPNDPLSPQRLAGFLVSPDPRLAANTEVERLQAEIANHNDDETVECELCSQPHAASPSFQLPVPRDPTVCNESCERPAEASV